MKLLITIMLSAFLFGCGQSSKVMVSDLSVETEVQDQNRIVATEFQMELGEVQFPTLTLPLPSDYGDFHLFVRNNKNVVGLDLNLTEILNLPPQEQVILPNGNALPLDFGDNVDIFAVPVSGINGIVYVASAENLIVVGFAFSIRQLDNIGNDFGNANVFTAFNVGETRLFAGVFTGEGELRTGIGAFAAFNNLFGSLAQYEVAKYPKLQSTYISRRKKKRLYRRLKSVMSKKQLLTIN